MQSVAISADPNGQKTQIAREKEENYQFIQCLATPIFHKKEKPFFAMSVSVPTFRYTEEKGQQIEKLLLEAKKVRADLRFLMFFSRP